jgi:putative transposase
MLRRHPHTPVHLALDDAAYFITGAIHQKRPLLQAPSLKQALLDTLRQRFESYSWALEHWVILDNHYHLIARSHRGGDLAEIMRKLHSQTARVISVATACELPVWWNYWDYCPRDEEDYFTRLNYLLYNPVRHGYVTDLKDYAFSSFHGLLQRQGRDALAKQFRSFPGFRSMDAMDDF